MKHYRKTTEVWRDDVGLVRVVFDEEANHLILEVGSPVEYGNKLFMQVSLNGFWKSLSSFMQSNNNEQGGK